MKNDRIKAERGPRRTLPHRLARDFSNRLRYGPKAPRSDETLWINPQQIIHQYITHGANAGPFLGPFHSGCIMGGDWDLCVMPVIATRKYSACVARFVEGKSWDDAGVIAPLLARIKKEGSFDECSNENELRARYLAIDQLYTHIAKQRQIKAQADGDCAVRGEYGGIFAHVNRHGKLLRYSNGNHRFAIARILRLPQIPIHIGVVHPDAITLDVLSTLRYQSADV